MINVTVKCHTDCRVNSTFVQFVGRCYFPCQAYATERGNAVIESATIGVSNGCPFVYLELGIVMDDDAIDEERLKVAKNWKPIECKTCQGEFLMPANSNYCMFCGELL